MDREELKETLDKIENLSYEISQRENHYIKDDSPYLDIPPEKALVNIKDDIEDLKEFILEQFEYLQEEENDPKHFKKDTYAILNGVDRTKRDELVKIISQPYFEKQVKIQYDNGLVQHISTKKLISDDINEGCFIEVVDKTLQSYGAIYKINKIVSGVFHTNAIGKTFFRNQIKRFTDWNSDDE